MSLSRLPAGDGELSEAGPGRRRRGADQACVPARAGLIGLGEQGLERSLPSRTQRRDIQGAYELAMRMTRQVEQRVDLGDGHLLGPEPDLDDLIAGRNRAFSENSQVEAGSVMCHQQRGHARIGHPDAYSVTGDPRLGHLEDRGPDPELVTDADSRRRPGPRR